MRIAFPDDVHHVTSGGDRREPIYRDDTDSARQAVRNAVRFG